MTIAVAIIFVALLTVTCIVTAVYVRHLEAQVFTLTSERERFYRDVQTLTEALCAANGNKVTLERKSERIEQLTKLADKAIVGTPYFAKGNGDAIMQSQIQYKQGE